MKNKELKEYLNTFADNADVSIILANPQKRKRYESVDVLFVTDLKQPVFCIEVGEEIDMDEEMKAACEECENEREVRNEEIDK